MTRQVGFESKGLELDLQKTAADYSFDPSEQARGRFRRGSFGDDLKNGRIGEIWSGAD